MRLNKNSCIQVHMRTRDIYVLNKERGQMPAHAIVRVAACLPAQKDAYFLKSMRIERRHSDFD